MMRENKALCTNIYKDEIDKEIKTLKRFRERWLNFNYTSNELFRYADEDFYFYQFAINLEEKKRIRLLDRILFKVLEEYNINFKILENGYLEFIINTEDGRYGYKFDDFYEDDDVNQILNDYEIDKAYIIRTVEGDGVNKVLLRNNEQYRNNNQNLEDITIRNFFEKYFSIEEYIEFQYYIKEYIIQSRKVLGYQSIKTLSAMNLSTRKLFEEKVLTDWDYAQSKYQIINPQNSKIKNQQDIGNYTFNKEWTKIEENYLGKKLYKAMIGTEDFAESFVTSEWLYYSLKGEGNFDYTAIVSGYLKSIEQLLHKVVMLNVDNNCVILLKRDKRKIAVKKGVNVYKMDWDSNTNAYTSKSVAKDVWKVSYPYIDFIESQIDYMDSSIGTFEYFLRSNPHIFTNPCLANVISDMVSCFRTECRNGFFHTDNLHNMDIVDKTRDNAILLYALLLGGIKRAEDKKELLGILNEGKFDLICKEIRNIRHYSPNFIFEYGNGLQKKMIYDWINNTISYTETGMEHYESLIFYEVEDFSEETYKKLGTSIIKKWRRLLTEDNLPRRIYCYDSRNNIHEVSLELLK